MITVTIARDVFPLATENVGEVTSLLQNLQGGAFVTLFLDCVRQNVSTDGTCACKNAHRKRWKLNIILELPWIAKVVCAFTYDICLFSR